MQSFEKVISKNINGLDVSLYDAVLNDSDNKTKLENEIISKIRSMKIH